jgi:hypothetical protein
MNPGTWQPHTWIGVILIAAAGAGLLFMLGSSEIDAALAPLDNDEQLDVPPFLRSRGCCLMHDAARDRIRARLDMIVAARNGWTADDEQAAQRAWLDAS